MVPTLLKGFQHAPSGKSVTGSLPACLAEHTSGIAQQYFNDYSGKNDFACFGNRFPLFCFVS